MIFYWWKIQPFFQFYLFLTLLFSAFCSKTERKKLENLLFGIFWVLTTSYLLRWMFWQNFEKSNARKIYFSDSYDICFNIRRILDAYFRSHVLKIFPSESMFNTVKYFLNEAGRKCWFLTPLRIRFSEKLAIYNSWKKRKIRNDWDDRITSFTNTQYYV